MATRTLLSDFDGVFTNQDAEAAEVGARLGEIVGEPALIERLRAQVRALPERHGWISKGILSCYADEDPYVFNNAVAAALYAEGPPGVVKRLRDAGFATHEQLSMRAFDEGTARFRAGRAPHVDAGALEAVAALVARGWRVVIVSNSSTGRIESLLRDAGFAADGERVAVRGNALKFFVGNEPGHVAEAATFGDRAVRLRRPHYYAILDEERPEALVGDVLSLDLALPATLRREDPNFRGMRLALRRHPHTPAWALAACAEAGVAAAASLAEFARDLGA